MEREELLRLAECVESATGADRDLDVAVWRALYFAPELDKPGDGWMRTPGLGYTKPAWSASLDAVLPLCAEKLPDDAPTLVILNVALSQLFRAIGDGRLAGAQVTADTIARYSLAALLRALAADAAHTNAQEERS